LVYKLPISGGQQLSTTLRDRRLRVFGHIARADSRMDYTRALRSIYFLDCHEIGNDLDHSTLDWQRAQARERWKQTVETATLHDGACSWWWWWYLVRFGRNCSWANLRTKEKVGFCRWHI